MFIEFGDKKYEIDESSGTYYLLEIEPPCNDRALLCATTSPLKLIKHICLILGGKVND